MADQFPPTPDDPNPLTATPDAATAIAASAASPPEPLGPIREGERLIALDVLRGFAVLGIYFVNMHFFAMPLMRVMFDPSMADAPIGEQIAWGFVKVFCEMKFISLFSMLFGIGLVVQMTRAEAKGRAFVPVFLRRLFVLALIGLAHALLLWYGDILFIYALIGVPFLFLRKLRPRTLVIIAVILCGLTSFFGTGFTALQLVGEKLVEMEEETRAAVAAHEAATTGEDPEIVAREPSPETPGPETPSPEEAPDATPPRGLDAMIAAQWNPADDAWQEAEIVAYRDGPLADAFIFRAVTYAMGLASTLISWGWRIGAMFLLGAAFMKSGFFLPERRAWQRRACVLGLAIGLPMEIASASIAVANDYDFNWISLIVLVLHDWGSIALAIGYLGAVTLIATSSISRVVLTPLASVGRLALTAYLSETVIATGIMYWWGLGWFGQVGYAQQIGLVVGIFAVLLVLATLWLKLFTMGPAEWAWRTLTYFRPPPIRRRS